MATLNLREFDPKKQHYPFGGLELRASEQKKTYSQWAKNAKVFQGGAGPNFYHFPLKTNVYIVKHQKLGKSVGRNGVFWIIFDLKNFGNLFEVFY